MYKHHLGNSGSVSIDRSLEETPESVYTSLEMSGMVLTGAIGTISAGDQLSLGGDNRSANDKSDVMNYK